MKMAVTVGAIFWNGGTFYGPSHANSLHLLNAYFTRYPDDADRVVISIKGPIRGDEKSVRHCLDECLRVLDGKKSLDVFQCARVDSNVPVEETVRVLAEYIKRGKLGGISLDGTNAEPIRRAAKVHRISCVELEFSLFAREMFENDVAKTCEELGIPIVAYSPLGRGFLTGQVQRADALPDGDVRKAFPRIQLGNFEKNLELVRAVEAIAAQKGCSTGSLAMAWVRHHSGRFGCPMIIPIPGATTADRVKENSEKVTLTESEFDALNQAVKSHRIVGARYPS